MAFTVRQSPTQMQAYVSFRIFSSRFLVIVRWMYPIQEYGK